MKTNKEETLNKIFNSDYQGILKEETPNEYTEFLDELRESGVTNMFGAGIYLQNEFCLDKKEAREILTEWMKNFKK